MSQNQTGLLESIQRVDYWNYLDNREYDVNYIAFDGAQVWVNKTSRMIWDAQRREFVGDNHRVPVDQVSQAVQV